MKYSHLYLTSLCFAPSFLIFFLYVQVFTLYYFQIASELSQVLTSPKYSSHTVPVAL